MSERSLEVAALIGALAAGFPHASITGETLKVYVKALEDIDLNVLRAAVNQCLADSEFFPTVAKIRQMCVTLSSDITQQPTPFEAWGIVLKETARTGYYAQPQFESELIDRAVRAIGWQSLCLSENQVADRAHFVKVYEQLLNRKEQDLKWLPQSRQMLELLHSITGRPLPPERETRELVELVPPTPEFLSALDDFGKEHVMSDEDLEN